MSVPRAGIAAPAVARLAALALLAVAPAGAAQIIHPGDKKPAPPPPAPTATHAAAFPDLQPFKRSPAWKKLVDHFSRTGLGDDALAALDQEIALIRLNDEVVARAANEGAEGDATASPSELLLGGKVTEERKVWLWELPIVIDQLLPLWNTAEWDAAQFAQAGAVARFFGQQDGPPKLSFVEGRHADNQVQLDRLLAWFRAELARPESYALMLITGDHGPWKPVEATAASSLKELGALPFDAERRLVLRRDEKAGGPWLVQLVKGKKPLWTRALTQVPPDSALAFDGEAQALGERGCIVKLSDGKPCALYLDAQGQPLFYFTSW